MLQIIGAIPYFLIFVPWYRRWMEKRFSYLWCLVFTTPVLLYSITGFLLFVAFSVAILLTMKIRDERLRDVVLFFLIWLPVEFNLLPMTDLNSGRFIGYFVVLSIFSHVLLFRIRPRGLGFTIFPVKWGLVGLAYLVLFTIIAPIGLKTGFIVFHPKFTTTNLLSFFAIYFFVAYPEEMLFRAFLFKILSPLSTAWKIAISSLIFGLAHFNGPHGGVIYMLLATIAGVGYAYVFEKSGDINSSALLHTLVDYTWVLFFSG